MTIRLLIVDDSALMRRHLRHVFEAEQGFVIRLARNGLEAIQEAETFKPDVITLDINMPEMDGLTALSHLMQVSDAAVVMVSSLTEKGALATLEALALGAVDFVAKPGGTISLSIEEVHQELATKVRQAALAKPRKRVPQGQLSQADEENGQQIDRTLSGEAKPCSLVVVGVSTGGPGTLDQILSAIEPGFPAPIVIAQHMPETFTGPFAQRLDQRSSLRVSELNKLTVLQPGHVYVARGGADLVICRRNEKLVGLPRPAQANQTWHPSADLLMRSAMEHVPSEKLIGVMLTGMGADGADAFAALRKRGGRTIAESAESAVVFGMPKELIARGGASEVLPLNKIAEQLNRWCNPGKGQGYGSR